MTVLTCKTGASLTWDAVRFVRGKVEDPNPPLYGASPTIPDSAFVDYVESAAEEFSNYSPLGEIVVGSIGANPPTSPLVTISNVSRYVLTPGVGFTFPVKEVIDVLYRASGVFTAASEIAYLALMPVSPLNWFRIDKDLLNSPTSRHIRDQYLQELDHYGIGYWSRARDPITGTQAIDIYPPPTASGLPIFVRYTSVHQNVPDGSGNPQYPTIPEDLKRHFGRFLLAEVMEQEADRLFKSQQTISGVVTRFGSASNIRMEAERLRDETRLSIDASSGIVAVSW
jgi:hypothetical protein